MGYTALVYIKTYVGYTYGPHALELFRMIIFLAMFQYKDCPIRYKDSHYKDKMIVRCDSHETIFSLMRIPIYRLGDVFILKWSPGFLQLNSRLVNLFHSLLDTVEYHYNAAHYNIIVHTSLPWLRQNVNQAMLSQKTHHISPSQMSYGMSVIRIWEKIDQVLMAQHYICHSVLV